MSIDQKQSGAEPETNPHALMRYEPLLKRFIPLCHWRALDKKGKALGKTPAARDWTKEEFDREEMVAWMEAGKNLGFRLGDGWGVLDWDSRRDPAVQTLVERGVSLANAVSQCEAAGTRSVDRLLRDIGVSLADCAHGITGGHGLHIYLKIPHDFRGREQIPEYPGVEFKHGARRYVVAMGSIHPGDEKEGIEPGRPYVWREGSSPISETVEIADGHKLLELYKHIEPPPSERGHGPESFGNFAGRLTDFLSRIPVERVRSGSDPSFEQVMMAAHWASGGVDREEFVEWCISDPRYSDHGDIIRKRWDSLAPRVDSLKTGLLFKMLDREGVPKREWPTESASVMFGGEDGMLDVNELRGGAPSPQLGPKIIEAAPYVYLDPSTLPKRDFLYGTTLLRGAVTVTLGHGGGGKSALTIVESLALVTGCTLLHDQPTNLSGVKVWEINLEDDLPELHRRHAGAAQFYGIGPSEGESQPEWASRLFLNGSETELCIAETTRDGTKICVPDIEAVKANIKRHGIAVVRVDPFVSSHRVTENDNGAVDRVAKQWAKIAAETGVAVELVHHSRKTNGSSVTDEDARGAVSLKAAARIMRQVNPMTEQQAKDADIEEEDRFDYFSVTQGKRNMSRRGGGAEWYKFVSVTLPNGDEVGVVTPFTLAARKVSTDQLEIVRRALEDGQARQSHLAARHVGKVVGQALGMEPKKVKPMIDNWLRDGALIVVQDRDERRKPVLFVRLGDWSKAVARQDLSSEELVALDRLEAFRAECPGLA